MAEKEAISRIQINKLLETAGWRFFSEDGQPANVAEIEAERALIGVNRELLARIEKKIQATLARVWGEKDSLLAEEEQ